MNIPVNIRQLSGVSKNKVQVATIQGYGSSNDGAPYTATLPQNFYWVANPLYPVWTPTFDVVVIGIALTAQALLGFGGGGSNTPATVHVCKQNMPQIKSIAGNGDVLLSTTFCESTSIAAGVTGTQGKSIGISFDEFSGIYIPSRTQVGFGYSPDLPAVTWYIAAVANIYYYVTDVVK